MIVGRAEELAVLDAMVGDLVQGRGDVLAVVGEPGIGKTTLLRHAADRAGNAGLRVLHLTASEGETDLPLAALVDLLGPLAGKLGDLPERQAAAVQAALAIGPPVATDPLTLGLATQTLLRQVGPALVVIDDAQWLDAASLACLGFVCRRLNGNSVGVLLGVRHPIETGSWLDLVPGLRARPLTPTAAEELLDRSAPQLHPSVRRSVLEVADGNPLALNELPSLLDEEEQRARRPLPHLLQPGERLRAIYARRLAGLDDDCLTVLTLAAAHDSGLLAVLRTASKRLGLGIELLDRSHDRGLVRIAGDSVSFVHPVARSAAYYVSPLATRRRVHAALAEITDSDQRAYHLAAATIPPNAAVADALAATARRAAARGAGSSAANAFERAASFCVAPSERVQLLFQAGLAALRSAQPSNARRLFAAVEATPATDGFEGIPDALRPTLHRVHGLAMRAEGNETDAIDLWLSSVDRWSSDAPEDCTAMAADAAHTLLLLGFPRRALAIAERALALATTTRGATTRTLPLAVHAACLAATGDASGARRALDDFDAIGDEANAALTIALPLVAQAEIWIGNVDAARIRCEKRVAALRESSTLAGLPMLLVTLAESNERLGRWPDANELATEAMLLASDTGNTPVQALAGVVIARIAAAQGDEQVELEVLPRGLSAMERDEPGAAATWARVVLARLALGTGDVERAITLFERVARDEIDVHGYGEAAVLATGVDLVEALLMAGRVEDAASAADRLHLAASSSVNPWTIAASARSRALLCADAEVDVRFDEATRAAVDAGFAFDLARTQLARGSRLHRSRRRVEARRHLQEAADGFVRLGALAWAERAQAEFAAAGGRTRHGAATTTELTDRERAIAERVAAGLTNREIGAQLFLSVKTIEFHLSRVYDKVGVRTRLQLARLLS